VTTDLQIKNPELRLHIDRDKAAAIGVSAEQFELALQTAYGSREISTIYAPTNNYAVIMELKHEFQQSPKALNLLYVRASTGALVPLDTIAAMEQAVGPLAVNHSGQFPSVTVSFNLRDGVALSEGVSLVENATQGVIPDSVSASFQGTAQAFQDSMRGMAVLLAMAVVVIYIVLGMLYESFIHPLTILSGLPSAAFGALLTLYAAGLDLNLYAFVGIVMLIGIVKKNAIMMLDFALEAERRHNLAPEEAIIQGCLIRFRPIMMTTFAAIMGALPIAIGIGAGAEARRPLGLAVVGGLCVSQLVTLFITPVYYIYMDKFGRWVKRRLAGRAAGPEERAASMA
jgi:HAE1 family hydrophobic/amphiphilic exporter-1